MAKTKSMYDLFQPLNVELNLEADRPYFEIDGNRTYLLSESGQISQNAVAALVQADAEARKYEKFRDSIRKVVVELAHNGTSIQKGDYQAKADTKKTGANIHGKVLKALIKKIFDKKKQDEILAGCREERQKKTIKINGIHY